MWAGNELDKVTAHLNLWCTNKTELLKKAHVKFFPAFLSHGITVCSVLNSYTFFLELMSVFFCRFSKVLTVAKPSVSLAIEPFGNESIALRLQMKIHQCCLLQTTALISKKCAENLKN